MYVIVTHYVHFPTAAMKFLKVAKKARFLEIFKCYKFCISF